MEVMDQIGLLGIKISDINIS